MNFHLLISSIKKRLTEIPKSLGTFALLILCLTPLLYTQENQEVGLQLEGNQLLSERELKKEINYLLEGLKERAIDEFDREDIRLELIRYYHYQGFPQVEIKISSDESRQISIQITEGNRTYLSQLRVKIQGSHPKKSLPTVEDIEACFRWQREGFLKLGKRIFADHALKSGIENLEALFRLSGFLKVQVSHQIQTDSLNEILIEVSIEPGAKFQLRKQPQLNGQIQDEEPKLFQALDLDLPLDASPRLPLILKGRLLDYYKNKGHLYSKIKISSQIIESTSELQLSYDIHPGPQVKIGTINYLGNHKTQDWVIRDRLRLKVEDLYSDEKIRESYRGLLRSGLFSFVRLETEGSKEENEIIDLNVHLEEKPAWRFTLLGGYGSYEQIRGGFTIENINIAGWGHRARGEGLFSLKGERLSLSYLNPYFFVEEISHRLEGLYERREHPSFTSTEYGGQTGWGYLINEELRTDFNYQLLQSESGEESGAIPPEFIDDLLISSVSLSGLWERRKNLVDPTHGSSHRLNLEVGHDIMGSQIDYVKVTFRNTLVFSLFKDVRLLVNTRLGLIKRTDADGEVPLQLRFFTGGENTIRSFLQDEAGPKRSNVPIGGETLISTNIELRFPIWRDLQGAAFYDIATINEQAEDFGKGQYSSGIGAGLRYSTPLGPFRFDAAWNPRPQQREDDWAFHFSLGYPF